MAVRNNGHITYEASWVIPTDVTNMCVNSCCDTYDDSIHQNARIVAATNKGSCFKMGDTYTVECFANHTVRGSDGTETSRDFTIGSNADLSSCFEPLICDPPECTCPTKTNGYCYTATDPDPNSELDFDNGDQVICRCNAGFVNTDEQNVGHLPYDVCTCNNGAFSCPGAGTCRPVQCANPYYLFESGQDIRSHPADVPPIGIPITRIADIGGRIEYRCADGYKPAQGYAPYSICDDAEVFDDTGLMGFFRQINGTCVGKYHSISLKKYPKWGLCIF